MRRMPRAPVTALGIATLAWPTAASGQVREEPSIPERLRELEIVSTATAALTLGTANYGRFLEQRTGSGRERELTSGDDVAVGGSVGFSPWSRTGLQLAFTWSPLTLKFEDDTGDGGDVADRGDLLDLDAFILSGEVVRFLFDPRRRFTPYVMAGISWTYWDPDGNDVVLVPPEILTDRGGVSRLGATGSLGIQIRITDRAAVRVEFSTARLGNPFEGRDGLRTASGETFDEPGRVTRRAITAGLVYSIRGTPPGRERAAGAPRTPAG